MVQFNQRMDENFNKRSTRSTKQMNDEGIER
uniref:Uncharacterized protein n=1 Tax=Setaria italica TaxID=4555 RepID=K3XTQ5_SETIT